MKTYPKVLLACPTNEVKDYCFDAWIENVREFTYPNFAILMVDNSETKKYSKRLAKEGISVEWVKPKNRSLMNRIAQSHELCRQVALGYNFDYLFHLESDIFPHQTIIEDLILAKKSVIGALYHIGQKEESELMVQITHETSDENFLMTRGLRTDLTHWLDGTIKKVYHIGLGNLMIHKSVLPHFVFRYEPNKNFHPDSFFAMDLYRKGIDIYADTSIFVKHDNRPHSKMTAI